MTLPLTIVVPVKNEAANLPACLASLPSGVPVIVVDSASTDGTVAIARAAGAEVLNFAWLGGFPKKRNWVLQTWRFQTPWVLFLDADERLTPGFRARTNERAEQDPIWSATGSIITTISWAGFCATAPHSGNWR